MSNFYMGFLNELWQNQPNTVLGIGLAILVLLGIYIKLLDIYQQYMQKFTLINKDRSRIKVFQLLEDVSKTSPDIDAIMISYGSVYKRSCKPVMKGSSIETVASSRKRI